MLGNNGHVMIGESKAQTLGSLCPAPQQTQCISCHQTDRSIRTCYTYNSVSTDFDVYDGLSERQIIFKANSTLLETCGG